MHFSFSTFFSDFVIFQVVKWMFLIFHDFQILAIFHVLQLTFLKFPPFSVFLAIFHVLKWVLLIFCDFQFSRHIPGPTVCISHFSRFSVISSFFKWSSGCFSFSMIFSFFATLSCRKPSPPRNATIRRGISGTDRDYSPLRRRRAIISIRSLPVRRVIPLMNVGLGNPSS